jgi:hypothetical protein
MNDHGQPPLQLDPLTEAATRHLRENPEHRVAAAGFLATLRQPCDPMADKMIARWDEIDAHKPNKWWLRLAVMSGCLIVLLLIPKDAGRIKRMAPQVGDMVGIDMSAADFIRDGLAGLSGRLPEKERFLLFGSADPSDVVGGRKSLWESDPQNPALYSWYVLSHLEDHDELPDGFLETARRIDPENSFFIYLAAAIEGKGAVEKAQRKHRKVAGKEVAEPEVWNILKPENHARALELIREAERLPRFDSYQAHNLGRIVGHLPAESVDECLISSAYLSMMPTSGKFRMRNLVDTIGASAWKAGTAGDANAYANSRESGERLLRLMMRDEACTVLDGLIEHVAASGLAASFALPPAMIGPDEETKRWQKIKGALDARNDARKTADFMVDGRTADPERVSGRLYGSGLLGLSRLVASSPPLTDADLLPGRMIDHEMMSWVFAWVMFLLMLMLLVALVLYRFRVAPLVRHLALRFESLLRPADWAWLLGGGLLVPLAYVFTLNRFTPWGGRAFSFAGTGMMLPTLHFAGLLVLWLLALWRIARWRLAKRAAAYGFKRANWIVTMAFLSALAFIQVIGIAVLVGSSDMDWSEWFSFDSWISSGSLGNGWYRAAAVLFAFPCMVLIATAGMSLIGDSKGLLRQALVARMMMRGCAVALPVCALAAAGFLLAEQFWHSMDNPFRIDASVPGWSRYEYQCALRMKAELRKAVGEEPSGDVETGR